MNGRLVNSDLSDPHWTAAADEAIFDAVASGRSPPTLHFYRRSPPAVSLGRFQSLSEFVDLGQAKREGRWMGTPPKGYQRKRENNISLIVLNEKSSLVIEAFEEFSRVFTRWKRLGTNSTKKG